MLVNASWLLNLFITLAIASNDKTLHFTTKTKTTTLKPQIHISTTFPQYNDTLHMTRLSSQIYTYGKIPIGHDFCKDTPTIRIINDDDDGFNVTCHSYERDNADTRVWIVSSLEQNYLAVVFVGTEDGRNWITNFESKLVPFGNSSLLAGCSDDDVDVDGVLVHKGFERSVFRYGLYDRIFKTVSNILEDEPTLRLFVVGHSLGAADSILTSVALACHFSHKNNNNEKDVSSKKRSISSVNFGSPRTGNRIWKKYVEGMSNLGVWRFVHGLDIVPRVPIPRKNDDSGSYHHVGHTLQLNANGARAYYLHDGDVSMGYAGVPPAWESEPYRLPIKGFLDHDMKMYDSYIQSKSRSNKDVYYVNHFQKITEEADHVVGSSTSSSEQRNNSDENRFFMGLKSSVN